jgi:hypothetical protein
MCSAREEPWSTIVALRFTFYEVPSHEQAFCVACHTFLFLARTFDVHPVEGHEMELGHIQWQGSNVRHSVAQTGAM